MFEKFRPAIYVVLNLIIINAVVLGVMNLRYPQVGHDYSITIPGMLDTYLHFHLNGLSIQWFTPTFAGGMPAFPNPNNGQFSLLILLTMIMSPWKAILVSTVIYISAGFLGTYYFIRRTMNRQWTISILGAVFFMANGFFISRAAPGQIGYVTFSLLPLFLIVLLDKSIKRGVATVLLGLLLAMFIHFAGYFVIINIGLTILIMFPLLYLIDSELLQWKRITLIAIVGGVIGLIISASKLAAVLSFMHYFPRHIADNYSTTATSGFFGIILELMGVMSMVPIYLLAGINPDTFPNLTRATTGTSYGLWELDMAVTPIVFFLLLIGLIRFIRTPNKKLNIVSEPKIRSALLLLVFFIWLGIEFTLAKGFIYPLIRNLPILSSLRVNVRHAAVFIFPLAFSAAILYGKWEKAWDQRISLRYFLIVNLLALLPLCTYFMFNSDMYWAFYDVRVADKIYNEMKNGDIYEVVGIGRPEGNNTGALVSRLSNLNVYEPIFGFKLEHFHPQVTEGFVWMVKDGYYNMTDPTGFVYPELNNNEPFARFRVEDKQTLELFVKHLQPKWKIPTYQHTLNWVSNIAFVGALLYLLVQGITNYKTKKQTP